MCLDLVALVRGIPPNYILRAVHPGLTASFAASYDASLRRALSQLVSAPPTNMYWDVVSFPFSHEEAWVCAVLC